MKAVALKAFPRTLTRRRGSKKLRAGGRVPAVIYGVRREQPANLEVEAKQLEDLMHHAVSENLLVNLTVEGDQQNHLALLQEIQHHPLSGELLHVDLHEVGEDEKVSMLVPIESSGVAVGVKTNNGVLEHVLFNVKVRAKPSDLPEVITVDVTNLDIGQSIHLGDLIPPPNCEYVGDKGLVVMSVAAPVTEAEEAAVAEAAAATTEVEMIKERKEEEAAGEAKAAGKPEAKAAEKVSAGDKAADKKK